MSSMSGFTNQTLHKKHKFKNKILFHLTFIIISFMSHKNSILELILTDTNVRLPKNIVIGQMLTDVQTK
jgi:hypothetical protein